MRLKNSRSILTPVLAGMLWMLTGCAGFASLDPSDMTEIPPQEDAQAEELIIALSAEAESMDPHFVYQQAGISVMRAVFDTLIGQDFDGTLVPGLAKSWEIVGEQDLKFNLRRGITFHNGEPFTAEAVRFSIERMLDENLNSAVRSNYTSIEQVEIVDDHTVVLHLASPDGAIFDALSRLFILPPQYAARVGDAGIATEPIGTGPYRFVEWVRDDHLTLTANPDYWEGSYKGQPEIQRVTFRPIVEPAVRIAELATGGAHIVQDVPPDLVESVEAAGASVSNSTTANQTYFFVTGDDPESPFSDPNVRRAINYAVDVEAIIDNLIGGYGQRIASPIGPATLGHDPEITPYRFDRDEALRLLSEAGYGEGFSVVMDVTSADNTDFAVAVAGQLAEVGIDVKIRELELAQFNENWNARKQSPIWRARWGNTPDPNSMELFLSCNGYLSRYCDEQITVLINQAKATLDQDERASIYAQISQMAHDNPVGIYGWTNNQLVGISAEVFGFRPHISLSIVPANITLGQ